MGFIHENDGTHSYLVYQLEPDDTVLETDLNMVRNNKIAGLVELIYTQIDEQRLLKYNITSKLPASDLLKGTVKRKRLLGVFCGVTEALYSIETEYNLVNPATVLLDLDYIYSNVSNFRTAALCVPIASVVENNKTPQAFFRSVMASSTFDSTENCDYVMEILNYLNRSTGFSLAQFRELLLRLQDGTKPASAPAQVETPYHSAAAGVPAGSPTPPVYPQPVQMYQSAQTPWPVQEPQGFAYSPQPNQMMPQSYPTAGAMSGMNQTKATAVLDPVAPAETQDPAGNTAQSGIPEKKKSLFSFGKKEKTTKKEKPDKNPKAEKSKPQKKASKKGYSASLDLSYYVPGGNMEGENQKPQTAQSYPSAQMPQMPQMPQAAQAAQAVQPSVERGWPPVQTPQAPQAAQPAAAQPWQSAQPQYAPAPNSWQAAPVAAQQPWSQAPNVNEDAPTAFSPQDDDDAPTNFQDAAQPKLVYQKTNQIIPLAGHEVFRIGRGGSGFNDFVISGNNLVGRAHCHIICRAGEYFIVDDNSKNHTMVNGTMIVSGEEIKLTHAQHITIANEEFIFYLY